MSAQDELFRTIQLMQRYGGGFASALGVAASRADPSNLARLMAAFPELFEEYAALARRAA